MAVSCMGIGYLFYDSWIAGVVLSPSIGFFLHWYEGWRIKQQKKCYLIAFKELLYALASNLRVGYSVENAWRRMRKDLQLLYPEDEALMKDIREVEESLELHIPIEVAVERMSKKQELEEVQSFSEVLSTARQSGGNLVHMMDKTAEVIAEKIEVEQEIQTILSGKKLEQKIMCGMPVLMLLYLRVTNPIYLEPLYHNGLGIILMTGCLIGTLLAAYWGNRLVGIEV
ncbi:MAG: type II secretion system F family protein [Clostridium sp.]|nr:type II secretion system F family protein [Clostridium sp.]